MIVPARPRILVAAALAAVLAVGGVGQAPEPVAAAGGYALELQRPGDFVRQTNLVQCVGASMQMMINIMAPKNDRTAATQHRLWKLARALGPPRRTTPRGKGASPIGWARGLDQLGYGPYTAAGFATLAGATKAAARAIRLTGKPVGVLVWAGRHAWVMTGFRATADPLTTNDFRVSQVTVMDPLYPLDSTVWGQSNPPGTRLSLAAFGRSFVPRRPFVRPSALDGTFVLVLPIVSFVSWARNRVLAV
ncbi:MAG: hypothetical protein QOF11_2419 [Chloroflexota bacterium]|jgi:hypothetical protein|nr:hypothetical protein [Chloroflexota bacterium]